MASCDARRDTAVSSSGNLLHKRQWGHALYTGPLGPALGHLVPLEVDVPTGAADDKACLCKWSRQTALSVAPNYMCYSLPFWAVSMLLTDKRVRNLMQHRILEDTVGSALTCQEQRAEADCLAGILAGPALSLCVSKLQCPSHQSMVQHHSLCPLRLSCCRRRGCHAEWCWV